MVQSNPVDWSEKVFLLDKIPFVSHKAEEIRHSVKVGVLECSGPRVIIGKSPERLVSAECSGLFPITFKGPRHPGVPALTERWISVPLCGT